MANFWPTGLGAVMPFALAVARSANAAQHGVDFVAIALGIGQALEHENRGAFAHDKAVRALGIGAAAGAESAPILQNLTKVEAPMLRSMPPVIATSKSFSISPSTAA